VPLVQLDPPELLAHRVPLEPLVHKAFRAILGQPDRKAFKAFRAFRAQQEPQVLQVLLGLLVQLDPLELQVLLVQLVPPDLRVTQAL
jgi:hypothetical protein